MPKFMLIHHEGPGFVSNHVNSACKICAREKRVIWRRVYFNLKEGRIFCEWEANDRDVLENTLKECGLPCEDILEVEEMTPDECQWDIFGEMKE